MLTRMRRGPPGGALSILLQACYTRPHPLCYLQSRSYSEASIPLQHEATDIAILGGGITGLVSAYCFSNSHPQAKITVFDAAPRLGGWLHSTSIDVGTGNVVFEQGPRNLRPSQPSGMVTLELIRKLGLENEVLMTSKNSAAAQNRYVYYPDHLVRMPGPGASIFQNIRTVLGEPIFEGLIKGLLADAMRKGKTTDDDESVASFLNRRFGPTTAAANVLSAVLHGIYAGDIEQLSAKSIIPSLVFLEKKHDTLVEAYWEMLIKKRSYVPKRDVELMQSLRGTMLDENNAPLPGTEIFEQIRESSVFTFKTGIGRLAERLEEELLKKRNVKLLKNCPLHSIQLIPEGNKSKIQIKSDPPKSSSIDHTNVPNTFSHAISTISGKALYKLTQPTKILSPISVSPMVTVMVVNLFYSSSTLLPVHGFGYLLPRSLPLVENPERALGVVFDSDATIGQDDAPGTKLTVMLGGHWWDGWGTYPDEEEAAFMAKSVIARHLKIVADPVAVRASLQRDCIPQYTVGHLERMKGLHEVLDQKFEGRLRVAGSSYSGVGLNDCVRSAFDTWRGVVKGTGRTGLEAVVEGEQYVRLERGVTLKWPKRMA